VAKYVVVLALSTAALSACVIDRPARPSLNESAQGPLAAPVTGSPIVASNTPSTDEAAPERAKPGTVWVRGYWHWDGVQYVWQRGHLETTLPPSDH
jgi:hypothetical protein